MREALALGAMDYRPEPKIYMRSEGKPRKPKTRIVQLQLFEEAA